MIFRKIAFGRMTIRIITLSSITLIKMPFNRTTPNRIMLRRTSLIRVTLGIMMPIRMTNDILKNGTHYNDTH